ncbi:uncharacterized protein LOC141626375 [Silene latifolia]|uniref:uncharacterized protein LOC141626375 n=1 Tax=Silene latifolia TaxID=37657 RepID=UPI003D76D122
MRNDCSPMPLVLAETLHCLDTLRHNLEAAFCGSPLLLQVWLQERMRLVERPLDPKSYQPHSFAGRQRVVKGEQPLSYWREWMNSGFPIRWTISWWHIPAMTAPRSSTTYYRLPGLTHSSFIFPSRLLRQFGRKQRVPSLDTISPGIPPMTHSYLRNWYQYWNARRFWTIQKVPDSTYISDHYKVWMTSHSIEERESARQAERRLQLDAIEVGEGLDLTQTNSKTQDSSRGHKSGGSRSLVWKRKKDQNDPDDQNEARKKSTMANEPKK